MTYLVQAILYFIRKNNFNKKNKLKNILVKKHHHNTDMTMSKLSDYVYLEGVKMFSK